MFDKLMQFFHRKKTVTTSHSLFCLFGVEKELVFLICPRLVLISEFVEKYAKEPQVRLCQASQISYPGQSPFHLCFHGSWMGNTATAAFQKSETTFYSSSYFSMTVSGSLNSKETMPLVVQCISVLSGTLKEFGAV